MNGRHAPAPPAGAAQISLAPLGLILLAFATALAPPVPSVAAAPLAAQEGTITYTRSQRLDVEDLPGMPASEMRRLREMLPSADSAMVLLVFGPSASLTTPVEEDSGERPAGRRGAFRGDRIRSAMMARAFASMGLGMGGAERGELRDTWVSHEEGTVVETRRFLGRTFRIEDRRPELEWRLTGEQAQHLDRMVVRATAARDSVEIEAWFAPDIPVSGGPAAYGGLPGMILVVSEDGGRVQYIATAVALGEVADELIRAPEDGDRVTRQQYEEIVDERLEEMRRMRRRPGGGR